ncbi:MAG: MMPL family transporter, partial [Flavobacteriales bacterium]
PMPIPYIHVNDPSRYEGDSIRIYSHQKRVGSLFSLDGKSISMLVLIEDDLSKVETDTLYHAVTKILDRYHFDEMHAAGKAIGQAFYVNKVRSEFTLFLAIAVILIIVILALIYRSVWGVIVPLIIVVLSVIWLLGIMSLSGKAVDIMTTLLPLVLFVVGISDVIHLLSRYFEEIRSGVEKQKAIVNAYKSVGIATFLTSLTTAIGFLTLLTSGVRPVRELGIYAAIGVLVAFVLAFSLLPALLSLGKVPKVAYREPSTVFWNKLVEWIFIRSVKNRRLVLIISGLFFLFSLWFARSINVDNHLLEDVADDDPIRASFEFFESEFSGVRPFELLFSVSDSGHSIYSYEVVVEMVRVESYLKDVYGVGFLNSPLSIIRSANQALHGGLDSAHVLPSSEEDLKRATVLVTMLAKRPEFKALMTLDMRHARFSGKIHDLGGKVVREKDAQLLEDLGDLEYGKVQLTGMSRLIDRTNADLSRDMLSGIFVALFVVALIIALLFKSVKLALISLIPNIIPLAAIAGTMGVFGIDLKVSTSVVFGIAFGIAVDDSIHFLMKFRQLKGTGRSKLYMLKRTSISTGKAIILTSVILIAGFISLSFSNFTSTHYVGLLISIALAIAVLADLFLLTALLLVSNPRKST